MNHLRIPVTIDGTKYNIEQESPGDPLTITAVYDTHDWIVVLTQMHRLGVKGKGWTGGNPQ